MKRSIGVCIILSIVTCGIYGIYWMIKLNDELNPAADKPNATSGGMVFLLSIITCGIYAFVWMYRMGENVDVIKAKAGVQAGNTGIMYLILTFFGLGIVNYCLMQDTINKYVAPAAA